MKWLFRSLTGITVSFILTMAVVVASFIMTMFSATEVGVRKSGLFGALFFEPHRLDNGATGLEIGVSNGLPILVLFVGLTVFSIATAVMLDRLKSYKKSLQRQSSHPA
jgi:hypothetical protein